MFRPKLFERASNQHSVPLRFFPVLSKSMTGLASAGTTVVMVTHSLVHAAAAKRTIKLLDGRVVSETLLAA